MTTALKERIFLAAAVLISLFFIFFRRSSFNDTLAKHGLDAYSVINRDHFSLREKADLEKEISELKTIIAGSGLDRNSYSLLLDENRRFRELLSVSIPDSFGLIYAKTAGRSTLSFPNIILINAGEDKGVSAGDPVITAKGAAGVVVSAGSEISRVKLINDPSNKIAVRTGNSGAYGILTPSGRNSAYIGEITKRIPVDIGEIIYTSDFSLIFPPGIPIAKVVSVSDSSATINKIIRVEFTQEPDLIEDVFVLKKAVSDD